MYISLKNQYFSSFSLLLLTSQFYTYPIHLYIPTIVLYIDSMINIFYQILLDIYGNKNKTTIHKLSLRFLVNIGWPHYLLQYRTIPPTTIIYPKDAIHYIHNIYYSEHDSAVILYVYDYIMY